MYLVALHSEESAKELLRVARQLRKSTDNYIRDNIFINADLTRAEAQFAYEQRIARRLHRSTTGFRPSGVDTHTLLIQFKLHPIHMMRHLVCQLELLHSSQQLFQPTLLLDSKYRSVENVEMDYNPLRKPHVQEARQPAPGTTWMDLPTVSDYKTNPRTFLIITC